MILNPVKTQVQLGVDEENAPFNPTQQTGRKLAIITDSFFYDALTYINGELQAPKVIVEPVAPVIRSWESLDMIDSLRREDFTDSNNKIDLGLLQRERKVRNLFSLDALTHNTLKDKSSKDLRSWLMIDREEIGKEAYAFRQLTPLQTTGSQQLELRIDFKNEAWKLESQFFQKV